MAKRKKNKRNLQFVTVWMGALALACILSMAIYGLTKWVDKSEKKEREKDYSQSIKKYELPEFSDDVNAVAGKPAEEVKASPQSKTKNQAEQASKEVNPANFDDENWTYAGDDGPGFWGDLHPNYRTCNTGHQQSPIDIISTEKKRDLEGVTFLYKSMNGTLSNNGNELKYTPQMGSTLIFKDDSYALESIKFHVPAEHQFNSETFDMEIQMIHRSKQGRQIVVAVLAKERVQPNPGIKHLWKKIPQKGSPSADILKFDVNDLLPNNRSFYYYNGSHTTPPCDEGVKWLVFKSPIIISGAQVDNFVKNLRFNARPVQLLYERPIYESWR